MQHHFDAFILIGGRSSRLGVDKAFVEVGGKSLTKRAVDVVRSALPAARITAVAGSETQFAIAAITSEIPFIFDLYEGRGPLGALHAALANARTEWILVLACDYPFVSSELLKLLEEHIEPRGRAVVPEQRDGRLQPLCAFYEVAAVRPTVEAILERQRVPPPMHEIVKELDARVVIFDEYAHLSGSADLFFNVNTTTDLEQARKIEGESSAPGKAG